MSIKKVDNYRIRLNEILGPNGTTHIGYNNLNKEEVIIKIFPRTQIVNKYKTTERFKQQVKFLHKIRKNATYVVRYLNLLETNNHFYLIQEFCKGGNLKKVLTEKKLTPTQAFKYMRHILKGFIELIKKGILHGNLTPSNILFHNGLMRLADFGLNVNQDIESIYSRLKNTSYLAPEVLQGKKYTDKSDIWSLGFIFYELLYGCVPWKTGGFVKIYLERIDNQPLQFPHESEVSEEIKNLIRGCLDLDPAKRLEWEDIFSKPIFNRQFSEMESIDIKLSYILGSVRKSLSQSNLDLGKFLESKKITNETVLNLETFEKILISLDPLIQNDEVIYLFNLFDSKKTNLIQFEEFRRALQHFDISLEFKPERRREKKKTEKSENKSVSPESHIERAIQKIVYQIKVKKIYDVYDVFIEADKDFSGVLDFGQFCELLRKIEANLSQEECVAIYKKMDRNNDGQLTFQQFMKSLCLMTGSSRLSS